MKILICTGIYPPDIGGPSFYAKSLNEEFLNLGHKVKVLHYKIEKRLPIGVRHFVFFVKTIFNLPKTDFIIALDTFSVGLPSVLASKIFKKKIIIRTGGDFLWESYINRTKEKVLLSNFYKTEIINLNQKEKVIFKLTKFLLKNSNKVVFSTKWQQEIFVNAYNLEKEKTGIVENFYASKEESIEPQEKNFLWTGRDITLKNLDNLKKAFDLAKIHDSEIKLDIFTNISHDDLLEKIKKCYVVILPSLSDISPNFILEAVMYNKPFIVTKETGIFDRLKNIGNFINPLDVNDIENKILFLSNKFNYLENKEKITDFNFEHSYKDIAKEFINFYKTI